MNSILKKAAITLALLTIGTGMAQARDQVKIVGSSTVYPFSSYVAEELKATTKFSAPVVESTGSGPVDAAFKAIEKTVQSGAELLLYSVNAITTGTDAQGEVTVRLSKEGRVVNGQGADTDIIVASAKAYLNALNKLHANQERVNPQI